MKRFFFSLIALSAAVIGCTKSELLETPGLQSAEVSFSPYTGRTPMTKATAIVEAKGLAEDGGFYVYGYLNQTDGATTNTSVYLDNKHVTSADGTNWSYGDQIVYWPEASSTSTLSFVAYSANAWGADEEPDAANDSAKDDNIVWADEKVGEEFIFTVPDAIDNQVDLVATAMQKNLSLNSGSDKVSSTGQVTLNFHHLLSRVGFKVQTSTSKPVTITDITLKGRMQTQGTLNLINGAEGDEEPALTPIGDKVVKEYSYVSSPSGVTISGAKETPQPVYSGTNKYLMLMPHSLLASESGVGSDHSINVSYKVGDSDYVNNVSAVLPLEFVFEAGKAYEFVLKLSTSSLSFDVQEEPWNTEDDKEVGPLEPDEGGSGDNSGSGDELDPEISTLTMYKDADISLAVLEVTPNSALIQFDILSDRYKDDPDPGVTGVYDLNDKRLYVAYKKADNTWTNYPEADDIGICEDNNQRNYTITHQTQPETTYELRALARVYNYTIDNYYVYYDIKYPSLKESIDYPILTFTTPSNFTDIELVTESPAQQRYEDGGLTLTKATLSHAAIPAQLNGVSLPISEYGFCWVSGNGTPSKLNNYINNNTTPAVTGDLTTGFSHVIDQLRPNASYTYCTYVVISADVYAYIIPSGKISAERTLIYPANTILYSAPFSFVTDPVIDSGDDTGSGWGEGGSTDILSAGN